MDKVTTDLLDCDITQSFSLRGNGYKN
jgi:hypothetical protein